MWSMGVEKAGVLAGQRGNAAVAWRKGGWCAAATVGWLFAISLLSARAALFCAIYNLC